MTASVEELEESTQKVCSAAADVLDRLSDRCYLFPQVTEAYARVSAMERRLNQLEQSAGSKEELRRRSGDLVRVYDALHEDVYDVKRKLFDLGEWKTRKAAEGGH